MGWLATHSGLHTGMGLRALQWYWPSVLSWYTHSVQSYRAAGEIVGEKNHDLYFFVLRVDEVVLTILF